MQREAKKKKQRNEKRSPLQDLNGFPIHKLYTKKSSDLSSSSSAAALSGEVSKGRLRALHSSNSSSSSSLRTHLDKKSRIFSKIAKNEPEKSTADTPKLLLRSRQNGTPKEPFLQKSKRSKPHSLTERQSCKKNAKPIYKNGQRSKISSAQGNSVHKLKKGSEEIQVKMKNWQRNNSGERPLQLLVVPNNSDLNCAENCTPVRKVTNECGLDSVNEDSIYEKANDNSANGMKTPPLEASSSPEIQCQSHSKMMVLKSAATPVCYGAGHLVSGITDKRKCRRRGSLKGFSRQTNLFDDDEKVTNDSQDSSIPSLVEASVRWMLSPCDDSENRLGLDQCGVVCDNALGALDLLSSPSMLLCGNASDSLCANSSYNGSGSVDNVTSERRNRDVIVSLGKDMDESLLDISPNATYSDNIVGDNSMPSIGSLNSGNVIQTPNSDSQSRVEVHDSTSVWSELDSMTETLKRINLSVSPTPEMSMWDASCLGLHFRDMDSSLTPIDVTQIQENVDSVSSWVSDATLDNLALSRMRISWRDGLASKIFETDEFDTCCCLSDEGNKTYPVGNNDQRTYPQFESGENKEFVSRIDNNLRPVLLDYEPPISTRGKEKASLYRPNTCAESICTDGGGLVASDDSGWTYCSENHMFGSDSYKWK